MNKAELRPFPREASSGAWPLLLPDAADKAYIPQQVPLKQRQQEEYAHLFRLDVRDAIYRGAFIGFMLFALLFTLWKYQNIWLDNWHWIITVIVSIFSIILFGWRYTFIALIITTCLISAVLIYFTPSWLWYWLLCILIGSVLRGVYEVFPDSKGEQKRL